MKKLAVASAVLAALTTSAAFASVSVDAYNDYNADSRKSKQGIELGYSPIDNLALTAEVTTNKDLDLGVAYTFDIADSFYVKPSVGYVAKWGDNDNFKNKWENVDPIFDKFDTLELSGTNSNVYKFGLEAGASFGDFFTSARYRLEIDAKPDQLTVSGPKNVSEDLYKERSRIGRTDLLVGYNFAETVTITAKGIYRSQLNESLREKTGQFNDVSEALSKAGVDGAGFTYPNSFWTSEIKATLTSIEGILPYVQYSRNYANKDDMIKLGAKFVF